MFLKNCERCGKAYTSSSSRICPDCIDQDEVDFRKVRDFVKGNPKMSIDDISEATEVDKARILDFLKMGRLELVDITNPPLECERCGKPISMGQYCNICKQDIADTFRSSSPSSETPSMKKKSFKERYRGE
ncbi:MerR family transcriptional regulator [bacterium]|nr:MerR family transcriptional regulator [bacterium]